MGYLIDRTDGMEMMMMGGQSAGHDYFTGNICQRLESLLSLLVGMAASFVPASVYAIIQCQSNQNEGPAFGIVSSCMNIGAALGPYLVGQYGSDRVLLPELPLDGSLLILAALFALRFL